MLLLVVASLSGGLALAALWPTTVETDYYAAEVSLSPSWGERSRVGTSTVVGEVAAEFSGLAPGVRVDPHVKPEITELMESGDLGPETLSVDATERARVIREVSIGVALRFAAGSAAGTGLVLLGVGLHRRSAPPRRVVLGALLATALVWVGVGLSGQRTYSPERLEALHSSGLLEMAVANRGLLGDVEERADQATPYLRATSWPSPQRCTTSTRRRRSPPTPSSRSSSSPTSTRRTSTR